MYKRTRIELVFEADIDGVPGWGDKPHDWIELIKRQLLTNSHYNTAVKFTSVSVGPSAHNERMHKQYDAPLVVREYFDLNQFNKQGE